MINPFDERRQRDPQGVIDDLLGQITRQAVAIYEKNVKLGLADTNDGVEPLGQEAMEKKIKPRAKPRAKKADKQPALIPDEGGGSDGNL